MIPYWFCQWSFRLRRIIKIAASDRYGLFVFAICPGIGTLPSLLPRRQLIVDQSILGISAGFISASLKALAESANIGSSRSLERWSTQGGDGLRPINQQA